MRFDKNMTEFPSDKHREIWKCAVNYLPEEVTLTDEMKTAMEADLFESCKQMRDYVFFVMKMMYENSDKYDFMPYQFLYQSLVEIVDNGEVVKNKLVIVLSNYYKAKAKRLCEKVKQYEGLFSDTSVEVDQDDGRIVLTSRLYPKMFRAMKELRNLKAKHGGEIFFTCDFRKLCSNIKHARQKSILSEKMKIQNVASEFLDANKLKNLTVLSDFLTANKLTPRDSKSGGNWPVRYKNKAICHIRLNDGERSWSVQFTHFTREKWFVEYDNYITDNNLKNFIWNNLHNAPSANPNCIKRGCTGIRRINILGKEHTSVCRCVGVSVRNPSDAEMECIKQLILVIKQYIGDLSI